jgi:hypothetical protein
LKEQDAGPGVEADEADERDHPADSDDRMLTAQQREAHRRDDEAGTAGDAEPAEWRDSQ